MINFIKEIIKTYKKVSKISLNIKKECGIKVDKKDAILLNNELNKYRNTVFLGGSISISDFPLMKKYKIL